MAVERERESGGRQKCGERAGCPQSERESNGSACKSDEQVLDEELADDSPAAGAHGLADSHFAAASNGANEQQVCDIGAGEQQQRSGKREKHGQGSIHVDVGAEGGTPERVGRDHVGPAMLIGKARDEALHEDVQLAVRLRVIDARRELAQNIEPESVALVDAVGTPDLLVHSQRDPNIGTKARGASLKAFGGDADDRIWMEIDLNCLSDDCGIAAVALLPEIVGKDGFGGAGAFLRHGCEQRAAEDGADAEGFKVIRRGESSVDPFRGA